VGCNFFKRNSDARWAAKMLAPGDPDPARCRILAAEGMAGHDILLVHYEGCTTFGGKKLLLLRRERKPGELLDPHLLGTDHIVMARFEPTREGMILARICALTSATLAEDKKGIPL
jgi:hypothetical protein